MTQQTPKGDHAMSQFHNSLGIDSQCSEISGKYGEHFP